MAKMVMGLLGRDKLALHGKKVIGLHGQDGYMLARPKWLWACITKMVIGLLGRDNLALSGA